MGSSVIVSQYFGAGRKREMKTAISTTFIAAFVLSVLLIIIGIIFTNPLLEMINTPPELLEMSALYLDIYIYGLIFLFFYNIATGIFTAMGDSRTPFIFLAISSTANIGADILFVTAFGFAHISFTEFVIALLIAVLIIPIVEIQKAILKRIQRKSN